MRFSNCHLLVGRQRADACFADCHIVDVDVVVGLGSSSAAEVEVQPDGFDLESIHVAHPHVAVLEDQLIIDPASKKPLLLQLESFGDGPRFSSRAFADRTIAAGLTGLRFEPTKVQLVVDRTNTAIEASFDTDLVEWLWVGAPCSRIATIEGARNVCPFCGFGTVVCSECGYVQDDCLECGDFVFKPNDSGKPGLRMLAGRDNPEIVEGRLWDGSDAICGRSYRIGFVTRRLVEFLLAMHAAPFMATPVAVCVDGMSAEQRRLLKRCQDLSSLKL